ncbi:CBS domain-containing protein [Shewanella sp. VB17]|uniref:CBS domain-containing protein n=1 Tax=Shewanella sp. VB17 TaxID=2739432 RepID=UPI001565AFB8|nr:CBS domain-containing protein [Shewanella sp. VB17]NRD75571.1 CBS domain-containing protein [Shewanella sp. VB17]
MRISELMSKNVVTVEMDDSLSKIKSLFEKTGFHHLLVLEDKRLFGIISDRDLLKSLSPAVDSIAATTKDIACLKKKAHQIMTRKPIAINENATVLSAIEVFNNNNISCIPITNNDDVPVGILSWRDIIRALGGKK